MKLKIHLSGIARFLSEKETLSIEIQDTENLYNAILETVPGLEDYYFLVSINGKKTENYSSLKTNDTVLVFSPIAGG
jgi:hypothetical protein